MSLTVKNILYILIFFASILLYSLCTLAQNLVPNPGFDNIYNGKHSIFPWTKINTIDFFVESNNNAVENDSIIDKNYILPHAHSSPACIGLRVQNNYREFIQVKLSLPLIKGHHYHFEMYYLPAEHCKYYIRSLGVSFYNTKLSYASDNIVKKYPPQIFFYFKKGLQGDNGNWGKLSSEYYADGGEQYITIGSFLNNKKESIVSKKFRLFHPSIREAYIYIDDISLIDMDSQ